MNTYFFEEFPEIKENWSKIHVMFTDAAIPSKTILLSEGLVADEIYFINEGCLRLWFNDEGRDITFQFFFEGQIVSSFESFNNDEPSLFNIETIEKSNVTIIKKDDFQKLLIMFPKLNEDLTRILSDRFICYSKLFLSRIKNSPEERYLELLSQNSQIIERIPHHYIASYLGITPVSLSRIRNRISSDINKR